MPAGAPIMSPAIRPHTAHAWRVAAAATLLVLAASVVVVGVFDVEVVHRLVRQVDTRLSDHLTDYARLPQTLLPAPSPVIARPPGDVDVDNAPLFLWTVSSSGKAASYDAAAPALVPGSWSKTGQPTTATLGSSSFRLQA
ncbi:MAG TPA: hypothetical protein VE991_14635, partial [Acidimicrobiales bacterium]|nr:hypothetical protein [Acidimicrobiales bacterium]